MGPLIKYTNRLILRVENESKAKQVLDLYLRNRLLYQNRGIAYEACEAALYVLEHDYQIHRVDARIHPENIASITLATKLGFRPLQFEPQSANILGHYVDLMRYTKLL